MSGAFSQIVEGDRIHSFDSTDSSSLEHVKSLGNGLIEIVDVDSSLQAATAVNNKDDHPQRFYSSKTFSGISKSQNDPHLSDDEEKSFDSQALTLKVDDSSNKTILSYSEQTCSQYLPMFEASTAQLPSLPLTSPAPSLPQQLQQDETLYHLKWITWHDKSVAIITQNKNGPCPLLAVFNALLLKNQLEFASGVTYVTANDLIQKLADHILSITPHNIPESEMLNYEQNVHDALALLPKLQTGIDVNVKFSGLSDFEYTPECVLFDLLHLPLCHGWLVDPKNVETLTAIGNCNYNQLVEKIIKNSTSDHEDLVSEALIASSFLETTCSQLTFYGLCELNSSIPPSSIVVFFRNNHFSTLYKHQDRLYILVTDQGFLSESNVIWESLIDVQGDAEFYDSNFNRYQPTQKEQSFDTASNNSSSPIKQKEKKEQQIDQDYLLALSYDKGFEGVGEDAASFPEQRDLREKSSSYILPNTSQCMDSDFKLAKHLQEQEDEKMAHEIARSPTTPTSAANTTTSSSLKSTSSGNPSSRSSSGNSSNKKCTIQ